MSDIRSEWPEAGAAAREPAGTRLPAARRKLLAVLSDGRFHSGEALGESVDMTRAAVWKHIEALQALGLDIHRVPGKGYRLARPVELLDADRILAGVAPMLRNRVRLWVLDSVDSTNAWLARHAGQDSDVSENRLNVCVAEHQHAGRGRRGRQWQSPFAANLYFSVDWPFETLPRDFSALSLVAGIAVRAALAEAGLDGVQLKWPNDLQFEGRKLGGILLELRGEPSGPCRVIIGIGINVAMPAGPASESHAIDQPWTDLATAGLKDVGRNRLVAGLLNALDARLATFTAQGFPALHEDWQAADALLGKSVRLDDGRQQWEGISKGVAPDGALLVEMQDGEKRFLAGDVSLRERT